MRKENQLMQSFLKSHGIDAIPKYIKDGSLKHSWRIYGLTSKDSNGNPIYQKWWDNPELINKFNELGFTDIWDKPLSKFSGNGGVFSIFVHGHYEFLNQ